MVAATLAIEVIAASALMDWLSEASLAALDKLLSSASSLEEGLLVGDKKLIIGLEVGAGTTEEEEEGSSLVASIAPSESAVFVIIAADG